MKHPSRAATRDARTRPRVGEFGETHFGPQHTEQAKANARAGARHGFVLAVAILLLVLPIIFLTNGCTGDLIAAELSIPGVLLTAQRRATAQCSSQA
jgi:hypothetical protein